MSRTRRAQSIIPDPYDTFEQALRFEHRDVEKLSVTEVWAELRLVKDELAKRLHSEGNGPRGAHDRAWLQERARRLDTEYRRRRRP